MYISKKRSGATFFTSSLCVELLTSASSATTSARATASAASASPYARRVATMPYRPGGARSVVQRTPTFESVRDSSAELTGFSQRGTPA